MTTTTRMSAPTPKSMPWPTPQRPAQATPVRRESVPAGAEKGNPEAGITPLGVAFLFHPFLFLSL